MLLALKNSHAGNDLDNCLTGEFVLCTMATGFLFWSSFLDPLPVTVCGGTPRLCHCGGNNFVRERKSPSEVSVKDQNWNHLVTLGWKTATKSPLTETQHFTAYHLCAPILLLLQPCCFESGFSFLNSVFCYWFLLVIALEEPSDGSSVISACFSVT